jgi:hypothetical protein
MGSEDRRQRTEDRGRRSDQAKKKERYKAKGARLRAQGLRHRAWRIEGANVFSLITNLATNIPSETISSRAILIKL